MTRTSRSGRTTTASDNFTTSRLLTTIARPVEQWVNAAYRVVSTPSIPQEDLPEILEMLGLVEPYKEFRKKKLSHRHVTAFYRTAFSRFRYASRAGDVTIAPPKKRQRGTML